MVVDFYDIGTIDDEKLEYAVICSMYKGKVRAPHPFIEGARSNGSGSGMLQMRDR